MTSQEEGIYEWDSYSVHDDGHGTDEKHATVCAREHVAANGRLRFQCTTHAVEGNEGGPHDD